jgi:hypothetical protein
MPFFFLVPLWILSIIAGAILLLFARLRFLSAYIFLASTIGIVSAFLVSLAVLALAAKIFAGTSFAWVALLAYLLGIALGGAGGILVGVILARS